MNIEDVMNKKVTSCQAGDSLKTAAQLMWENDIGCVAVIDAGGKPIGMITDRDLAMSAYLNGRPLEAVRVSQAMSRELHFARIGQSIHSAGELMRTRQIRRVPVVDASGKLAGIVSLNDLALAGGRTREVKPEQVTATLASICQPRRPARA